MLNTRKFKTVVFFSIIVLFGAFSSANADSNELILFTHPKLNFSLSYPSVFETIPPPVPVVGLALRHKEAAPLSGASESAQIFTGGFPTVTVTVHPSPYSVSTDPSNQAEEILNDYKKIGLTTSSLRSWSIVNRTAGNALTAQIKYQREGTDFISSVTVFPGSPHHFMITYLDRESSFNAGAIWRDAIISSFESSELVPQVTPDPKARDRYFLVVTSILGLVALFALWWAQTRAARNREMPLK